MPKMDDYVMHTPINTLLDLYRKVYGIPYVVGNKDSMHDLCFLMNEIGLACGDDSFGLYYDGPRSSRLGIKMSQYFENTIKEEDIRNINYRDVGTMAIQALRDMRNRLDNSSFTSEEIQRNIDVIYWMNAIAIAKYLIEYEKRRDVLDTLNTMRDKKDVNEIAVIEARKLSLVM